MKYFIHLNVNISFWAWTTKFLLCLLMILILREEQHHQWLHTKELNYQKYKYFIRKWMRVSLLVQHHHNQSCPNKTTVENNLNDMHFWSISYFHFPFFFVCFILDKSISSWRRKIWEKYQLNSHPISILVVVCFSCHVWFTNIHSNRKLETGDEWLSIVKKSHRMTRLSFPLHQRRSRYKQITHKIP